MKKITTILAFLVGISSVHAQTSFNHPTSGFIDVTLGPGTYNYYDNGGPNGNYTANVESGISFIPQEGYYINILNFTQFHLEDEPNCNFDKLSFSFIPRCGDLVINFEECGGPKSFLWGVGELCAGEVANFYFVSDGSVQYAGWKAVIEVLPKDPKTKICQNDGVCNLDVGKSLDCDGGGPTLTGTGEPSGNDEIFNCWTFGPCVPGYIDLYPGCSSQKFLGPERIYPLSLTEAKTIFFECECMKDVFLLNQSCNCVTKVPLINGKYILENVPAGEYFLVAEYWCDGFDLCFCDFSIECIDIGPGELDCSNSEPIGCNATILSSNAPTNGGLAKANGYCVPSLGLVWTGREKVYTFTSDINGLVKITLSSLSTNLDLFVLKGCDRTSCVSWSINGGASAESITLNVKKGETYTIVVDAVGFTQSTYLLEVQCEEKETCVECGECFTYSLVNKGVTTEVLCRSKYNDCTIPNFPTSNHSFRWTVDSIQVSTMQNPTITIPTGKSVTICQEIRLGTTLIYRCCWTVEAAPGCQPAPVAHWKQKSGGLDYDVVLNASGSKGTDNIYWDFGLGKAIVGTGKDTLGKQTYASGFNGKACVYVQNSWGISQYCKDFAPGAWECSSSASPKFEHTLVGNTLNITSDNPQGIIVEWEIDYGNGTRTEGTGWSSQTFNYASTGVYEVCIRFRVEQGSSLGVPCSFFGCLYFTVKVGCCTTVLNDCPGMRYQFVNANGGLLYSLSKPTNLNQPVLGWEVNDIPVPQSGSNSIQYLFPTPGLYKVCLVYRDPVTGCFVKCCRSIWIGDPFDCGTILFLYESGKGYQFFTNADGTDFIWTNDDTGEDLGTGKITQYLPVPGPGDCIEANISVRYYDPACQCWRICCLRIYLCNPEECNDEITVFTNPGPNPSTVLCVDNAFTDVRWSCQDNNQPLGTGNCINVANQNCQVYCVQYYDPVAKRFRVCCRDLKSSLFEPEALRRVEIRPNPFGATLDVKVEFVTPLGVRLELLDAQGRIVEESRSERDPDMLHQWQLDTRHLADGVYVLRIITGEGEIIRKVVKLEGR